MISLNPIGITATSQTYAVTVTEKLCKPFCESSSIQPFADGSVTVDSVKLVGNTEFVRVKIQGFVTYVPQNGNRCAPCQKVFTEYFDVAFIGIEEEKIPTVTVDALYTEPAFVNCYGVACGVRGVANLTVKIP